MASRKITRADERYPVMNLIIGIAIDYVSASVRDTCGIKLLKVKKAHCCVQ